MKQAAHQKQPNVDSSNVYDALYKLLRAAAFTPDAPMAWSARAEPSVHNDATLKDVNMK